MGVPTCPPPADVVPGPSAVVVVGFGTVETAGELDPAPVPNHQFNNLVVLGLPKCDFIEDDSEVDAEDDPPADFDIVSRVLPAIPR